MSNVTDHEDWNALHCAAKVIHHTGPIITQAGYLSVVVLLTGTTATDVKTSEDKVALWYACVNQHKDCVEFLLR